MRFPRGSVAAATAVAAAATTTASAAEAARTVFLGACLVHHEGAAVHRLAVQATDRGLGFGVRAHLHEAKALGAAGVAIHHDLGRRDRSEFGESLLEIVVAH